MPDRRTPRVTVLAVAALSAAAPATSAASAAPVQLGFGALRDITSDGRYLLFTSGDLVDRASGETVLAPSSTLAALDLADRAPAVLVRGPQNELLVRTPSAPGGQVVTLDAAGSAVPAGTGRLVRNGHAVVFDTLTAPRRVLLRDLDAGTTTTLLGDGGLLDASEDGRVITFSRRLPAPARPAGSPALPGDPDPALTGSAVGYVVDGGQPRIVSTERRVQRATGPVVRGCPTGLQLDRAIPTDLQVSQDGAAGGRYALVLSSTQGSSDSNDPRTTVSRLTPAGSSTLASDTAGTVVDVMTDPVSGAWGTTTSDRVSLGEIPNDAALVGPDGARTALGIPPVDASGDTSASLASVLPYDGGRGVAFSALPFAASNTTAQLRSYALEPVAVDHDATPWLTLPRPADPADGPGTTVAMTWLDCAVAAGALADYATFTPRTTGGSAGTVTVRAAPAGKIPLAELRATVSWNGVPLWTRTSAGAPVTLPSILPGVPGFRLTLAARLADGTRLTSSIGLRRTR